MHLRERLYDWSGKLQHRITPGLPYSQTVFEQRLFSHVTRSRSWLDLGCGHRILPEWRGESEDRLVAQSPFVVGLDSDAQALQRHRSIRNLCLGDITRLPFRDESFDLVTANMVVEHLPEPGHQFAEVARVLAPGGTFVFHTPNLRSYIIALARMLPERVKKALVKIMEGREGVDVYPTFYRANEATAITAAAKRSGLELAELEFVPSTPAFHVVPPLLIPELLWIRQLQRRPALAEYRHTLICALRRPA
jgi:SAM-dependent methyltransferase